MKTQDPHSTPEGTQEEQTMKKNTQGAVKMNGQWKINAAVNYWNSEKSWERILSELGFVYRTEPTDTGTKIIVHDRRDPKNVHGVAEEYSSGEQSKYMVDLSDHMMAKLNTSESSVDREEFFCGYIFYGDWEKMRKKEIIPFYERHLRDLAAEDEDDTTEDTTTKKGATTMNNHKNLRVIDRTEGDAHIVTETAIIHDLVGGNPSIISYDEDIESALEEMVGPLPEDHSHLPEEYAYFWNWCNDDKETIDGFEKALGIRIEYFEDFLRENSEEWTDNGIEVKEPNWRYPEDCISETTKK